MAGVVREHEQAHCLDWTAFCSGSSSLHAPRGICALDSCSAVACRSPCSHGSRQMCVQHS